MLAFLKQPYPFGSMLTVKIRLHAAIGIFVALFLMVFEPFQTDGWTHTYKYPILAGYGIITFAALLAVDLSLYWWPGFEALEKKWTVGSEIAYSVAILLLIALGNMMYAQWIGISVVSWKAYWQWSSVVLMVGFFPITGLVLLRYHRFVALNRQEAVQMEASLQDFRQKEPPPSAGQLTLTAENEKDHLTISPDDFLYIESADNYAIIVHREGARLRKSMLRGSMKRFEEQLCNLPEVARCHRSYLVNLRQVEHIRGNAQGYRLLLRAYALEVPVSRQYAPAVLARIKR
jgi:DNA-binding LytR/AlgR family response regulator